MELSELRKILKPLGFKVKTKSLSHGRHATITDLSGMRELTGNVFTSDQLAFWSPAIEACRKAGQVTQDSDKVYGLNAPAHAEGRSEAEGR